MSTLMTGKWEYHPTLSATSKHSREPAPLMLWINHPDRCQGFSGVFHQRNRCNIDTAAESHALKETGAPLIMIYAQKKLYPLTYTLKDLNECRFHPLGSHLAADIVHQDCSQSPYNAKIYSFADTRPSTDHPKTGCNEGGGYRVQAWFQAFWQLLFGQMCTEDLTCTSIAEDLPQN